MSKHVLVWSALLSGLLLLIGSCINNNMLVSAGLVLTLVASILARPFRREA